MLITTKECNLLIVGLYNSLPPSDAVTNSLLQRYSCRNLVFMSTSIVPAVTTAWFRPFQQVSLAGRISFSNGPPLRRNMLSREVYKPLGTCQFLRETFYQSLTLLSQTRPFWSFVLETLLYHLIAFFPSFFSFLSFPFASDLFKVAQDSFGSNKMCQFFCQNLLFMAQAVRKWNNIRGSPCSIFQKLGPNIAIFDLLKYGVNGKLWLACL